jgi:putative ABC transport system permease protein
MGRRQDRLFRALLNLFPREFRGDFGDDMAADFQDQREAAAASGRRSSVLRVWTRTIVDMLRRAPREHLDVFLRDAGYAIRLFGRRRAMTMSALVTLAVGIGLNAAAFSMIEGVLWRPLPLPDSDRLVRMSQARERGALAVAASPGNVADWHEQTKTLDAIATIRVSSVTITGHDGAEEFIVAAVTRDFFPMLAARPALGRLFAASDYVRLDSQMAALHGAAKAEKLEQAVTIISYDLWQRQFGGRANVIGERVDFGKKRVLEVVGVASKDFVSPIVRNVHAWVPDVPDPDARGIDFVFVLGRLAPGASVQAARAEFQVIGERLADAYPVENSNRGQIQVISLRDNMTASVRTQLWFLFGMTICVLLIACANVMNLLLTLASGRQRELATRLAVGASMAHLVRQAVTEAIVLSAAGGLAGFLLARWTVPALIAIAPRTIPRLNEVSVGPAVLVFTLAISIAVGLVAGVGTAFAASRSVIGAPLRTAGAAAGQGRRLRHTLIVVEVALALMLAVAATLLVQTMRAVTALPLGFTPQNVIAAAIRQDVNGQGTKADFEARFVSAIRRMPGVVAAGVGSRPLTSAGMGTAISLPDDPATLQDIAVEPVGVGYLEALGARIVEGRFFDADDDEAAPPVAIVNQVAARRYWSSAAVGQTFVRDKQRVTVVGVLGNVRHAALEKEIEPMLYLPDMQTNNFWSNHILVRTAGDPGELLPAIRTVVRGIDPRLPVSRVETLEARLDAATAPRRFTLWLVGLFSLIAVALAAIGVYGVLSESVSQRSSEIGIRMTLGATASSIMALVLRRAVGLIVAGVAIGIGGTFAAREIMSSFVYGVTPTDAWSYAVGTAGLLIVTLGASAMPARRAARIDPVVALRQE